MRRAVSVADGSRKVRYAIVGIGLFSGKFIIPAVGKTENSEVTALVSSDAAKAREVGRACGAPKIYRYEEFGELLRSGEIDAVWIATPNWRHAEFAVPALEAGIHVLVEKPMEISTAKCREIVEAAQRSSAKLMVSYRLHFEQATLSTIDLIRSGELGDVHLFTGTWSYKPDPANYRTQGGWEAGPLLDMGVYPVNAARYVFEDEPIEVAAAVAVRHADAGFGDLDDTVLATLRFPNDKVAQFAVSYHGTENSFCAMGTKGTIHMNPGTGAAPAQHVSINGQQRHYAPEPTDHVAGELAYFSDCILENDDPEPDAEEGYADLRVIEGILQCLETGAPVQLPQFTRSRRIDTAKQLKQIA